LDHDAIPPGRIHFSVAAYHDPRPIHPADVGKSLVNMFRCRKSQARDGIPGYMNWRQISRYAIVVGSHAIRVER
jgi:hypothetical protein